MHNNYYFLRQLSQAIQERVQGMELTSCFSQNKNELILGFTSEDRTFYIKAHLQSDFCCLAFPEDFSRSRKNSVDLFRPITHKKVINTHQYLNERCFSIVLEEGFLLLFKMHGNRSNILLFENGNLVEKFNNNLKNDDSIIIDQLDREIERSKEILGSHNSNYKPLFPTFGKQIQHYIEQRGYSSLPLQDQWELLTSVEKQLLNGQYYIVEDKEKSIFSLLPFGNVTDEFSDPILAINTFFQRYIQRSSLMKEKREALSFLENKTSRTRSYIKKSKIKLESLKNNSNYSQWADIIMANLHQIPTHANEVSLQDFYNDLKPISIKLKPTLSPQKNAEIYYRKSKNQQIEINKLQESIDIKVQQLSILESHLQNISEMEDVKSLRNYLKEHQLTKVKQETKDLPKPYLAFELDGFDIWIGKNAKNNDVLTQKLSFKEDLWLHAKDVSGSHVLIKHKAGRVFPKHVIEYAAQLAAYYSKRKTDSLCPVIYTPKKFVRKLKGAPAGAVIVDKEQVILVTPMLKKDL